jgi:HTH-type transcriptional regulator/antitoxin HipB
MNNQDLTTMVDIGKIIRDTRKEQGLTQEELAGISGTGRRFISDLENGKNSIQTGKLLLVIKALGLNLYIFNKWEIKFTKNNQNN